jgi:hypothetical protein
LFVGDRVCISTQPTVATPPSAEQFTRKQSKTIIREVWPDELEETALFVAQRESNLVHSVVGGKGDCCIGLFQIYWSVHRSWLAASGITTAEQLLNPRTNAEAALALYLAPVVDEFVASVVGTALFGISRTTSDSI